jgi:hypothetical protein
VLPTCASFRRPKCVALTLRRTRNCTFLELYQHHWSATIVLLRERIKKRIASRGMVQSFPLCTLMKSMARFENPVLPIPHQTIHPLLIPIPKLNYSCSDDVEDSENRTIPTDTPIPRLLQGCSTMEVMLVPASHVQGRSFTTMAPE